METFKTPKPSAFWQLVNDSLHSEAFANAVPGQNKTVWIGNYRKNEWSACLKGFSEFCKSHRHSAVLRRKRGSKWFVSSQIRVQFFLCLLLRRAFWALLLLVGTGRMLAGSTAFNLTRSGNSAVHGLEVLNIDRAWQWIPKINVGIVWLFRGDTFSQLLRTLWASRRVRRLDKVSPAVAKCCKKTAERMPNSYKLSHGHAALQFSSIDVIKKQQWSW